MKEKEIGQIIRALDQIGSAVKTIKAVLLEVQAGSAVDSLPSRGMSMPKTQQNDGSESGTKQQQFSETLPADKKTSANSTVSDGLLDVLDLSGDIKKVQLALMRLGKGTAADIAKTVSLDVDEVTIYLKTLMRDSAIVAHSSKGTDTVYRTVLKKKGKKPGGSSLLDKLL